ncbi:MAG: hypothetical protein Q8L07_04190 [Sediminibacterium sp.]|nr:hypothetical protein [Sediminibacterium sp.]
MNGTTKTMLLVGGTAVGIFLYDYISKKIDTANKLSANVVGIKLGQLQFPDLQLQISVLVTNQSQADAIATNFSGSVTDSTGKPIGSFSVAFNSGQQIVIPANGQARIDVNSVVNVLSTAQTFLQGQRILIDGTVIIDHIPVPVQTDLSIGCACSTV